MGQSKRIKRRLVMIWAGVFMMALTLLAAFVVSGLVIFAFENVEFTVLMLFAAWVLKFGIEQMRIAYKIDALESNSDIDADTAYDTDAYGYMVDDTNYDIVDKRDNYEEEVLNKVDCDNEVLVYYDRKYNTSWESLDSVTRKKYSFQKVC